MKVCILRRQCLISTVPENPHFPVVMSAFERFDALKISTVKRGKVRWGRRWWWLGKCWAPSCCVVREGLSNEKTFEQRPQWSEEERKGVS